MGQWLRFMARLTKAQHAMASAMGTPSPARTKLRWEAQ
jgi:hypothetical protein